MELAHSSSPIYMPMSLWYKSVARPAGGGAAGIVGQHGVRLHETPGRFGARSRKAGVGRMGLYAAAKERMASEEGATAVEYALMIALIALVIVVAVTFLGQETNSVYENGELITALT